MILKGSAMKTTVESPENEPPKMDTPFSHARGCVSDVGLIYEVRD